MDFTIIKHSDDVIAFIKAQSKDRQHACAVFLASRAALRGAAPAIELHEFSKLARERDLTSLLTWRCLLTSSVANIISTRDVRLAASASSGAAYTAAAAYSDDEPSDAAYAVAYAAGASAGNDLSLFDAIKVAYDPAEAAAYTAAFVALAAVEWVEVSQDAKFWTEHADLSDGTLSLDMAQLWSDINLREQEWLEVRKKLLAADTPDPRGADWSFWVKWYDDILAGNPQNWDMLYEISTTDAIAWDASAREVNDTINGIVEKFENIKSDQNKVDTQSEGQKVSPPPKVDGGYVAESLQRHATALPLSLDAITFIIENEIKRLQEKNYQDDLEAAESKRLINVLMSILRATEELSAHVPVDRKVEEEDTKAATSLIHVYHEQFSSWARTSAPDVVDGTCRMGLVAGVTSILTMCGAPVMVAAGIAGLAYGGPRLKDVGKTVKDALKD